MLSYPQLEKTTLQLCSELADNPEARQVARLAFFDKFSFAHNRSKEILGYELDLYDNLIKRGVLEPSTANVPGSAWWRNINQKYLYFCELANALFAAQLNPEEAPTPVKMWLNFMEKPTIKHWYRAHNCAIFSAAQSCRVDAIAENDLEQLLFNVYFYRLMYVQAVAEDIDIFGNSTQFLAGHKRFGKHLIKHLAQLLPGKYPLDDGDKSLVLGYSDLIEQSLLQDGTETFANEVEVKLESISAALFGNAVDACANSDDNQELEASQLSAAQLAEQLYILDQKIILPHLHRLYQHIAQWNEVPFVMDWIRDNKPVYPAI